MISTESKKFIVYKSSAGSGKTFTLVREYLKIVLGNPEAFRQVLAITFTNKAANEMKERVVRNLIVLSDPEKNRNNDAVKYMLPQLSEQLNLDEKQIAGRAAIVLRLIMHHYAEFAISTIDSFTHRVIRTFAHDLKIPMNFEVELDVGTMLSQAVDLLISQVGTDEKLTRVLVDFVEKKAGEELSWQIEKDLNDFGSALLSEASLDAINELRNYDLDTLLKVRQSMHKWKITWEKTISKMASDLTGSFSDEKLYSEAFIQKERGIYGYFKNLAEGNFEKLKPNSYAEKALTSGEWINPKATPANLATFETIAPVVIPIGNRIHSIIENEMPAYILCKLLLNNIFSTALLSEIEKTLNLLCTENNKLMISEFNRRISHVVQEQPAPFIYERLGEKYHHYLIDEFQDTSVMQWHNLLPLIENSLASNRMNLVVGDAKQAIYRWRSGDAEQFEMLPGLIRTRPDPLLDQREQALVHHFKEEYLAENHRSSPVIVDFNNRLFGCIARFLPERHGEAFRHAEQVAAKKDMPGMVRLEKVAKGDDQDDNYEEKVHTKILDIISELTEDGFLHKDLAILCRKNEKAAKIASFLIRHDIPVISSESLLLTQSEQVNVLVAWIRHIANPNDTVPMAHIFHYLSGNGKIDPILIEGFFGNKDLLGAESFHQLILGCFPFFNFNQLKRFELFGLVRYLNFHFNFNELKDSYLRFFQDAVLEYVKTSKGGLPEFLEWWEEKKDSLSVVIPEGINAVRIMTVHKAKGLQFPVVIYPFADETLRPTRNNLWVELDEEFAMPLKTAFLIVNKSLSETKYGHLFEDEMNRSFTDLVNVLYVALTRPVERLYVLLNDFPEKTDDPVSVPKLLSRFLVVEGIRESGKNVYEFGNRYKKLKPEPLEEEPPAGRPAQGRAVLKMLLRRHAPSAWDVENPEKNREWGNLVHRAMEMITDASHSNEAVENLLDNGLLTPDQKDNLSAWLAMIFKNVEIARFYDPSYEVKNEPEIMSSEGRLYRPDRLLLKNNKVTIIDFKTGKFREEHKFQIEKYADLLSELNYEVEGAYLLYLNPQPQVVKVC
jgi:ATP-dependent exoDNAse (exonuclease V) beta subunit